MTPTILKELSVNSLQDLHAAIKVAQIADNKSIENDKKPEFGVYDTADWKEWKNELEKVMNSKGISFEPITLERP